MKNIFSPLRGAEEHHPGEKTKWGITPQSPELPPPDVASGSSPKAEEGRSHEGRGAKDRETERHGVGKEERQKEKLRETHNEAKRNRKTKENKRNRDGERCKEKGRETKIETEKERETHREAKKLRDRKGERDRNTKKDKSEEERQTGREVRWSPREKVGFLLQMATWASEKPIGTESNAAYSMLPNPHLQPQVTDQAHSRPILLRYPFDLFNSCTLHRQINLFYPGQLKSTHESSEQLLGGSRRPHGTSTTKTHPRWQ